MIVPAEGGMCFVISLLVRPGQVKKKPVFIVLIYVGPLLMDRLR